MRVAWLSSAGSGALGAGGAVSEAGRGITIVRSSPLTVADAADGGTTATGRAPDIGDTGGLGIGIVARVGACSGSISSVSGRSKSAVGGAIRLASPTGSSIGGGGTYAA